MMHMNVLRKRIKNWAQHEVGNDEHRDGKLSSESSKQSVARATFSQFGGPIETVICAFVPETSKRIFRFD